MDKAILMGIQEYIRNDYLTPVMLFVSAIGSFGAVWLFMAMLLAFSRFYLGAHYPTDVLAGVVVAYLGSAFVWRMGKKIGQVINIG